MALELTPPRILKSRALFEHLEIREIGDLLPVSLKIIERLDPDSALLAK